MSGVSPGTERNAALKDVVRAIVPRAMRNWLRSPSKSAEWLWDCAQFSMGVTRTVPLHDTWNLRCHPRAYKVTVRDQVNDSEQREEFENFLAHCSREMFLFDVGAHFGVFSLAAAHFGGRAVAVDPSPTAVKMIARQAALNGLSDRIQVIRAALSETGGALALLSTGVFSDGYFQAAPGRSKRELTEVPASTIDELCARFGAPTHIKIDVEGHEGAVLRGARETIRRHTPVLFLELHSQMMASAGGDPDAFLNELDRLGYVAISTRGKPSDRDEMLSQPIARIVAKPRG